MPSMRRNHEVSTSGELLVPYQPAVRGLHLLLTDVR